MINIGKLDMDEFKVDKQVQEENIRDQLNCHEYREITMGRGPQMGKESNLAGKESFLYKYILSSLSAIVAESVTYPLDLTKTRLQIQGEIHGGATSVSHAKRGMFKILYGIATEEGPHKLWQGVSPALYRHIVYSGCRMCIYEFLRDRVFKRNADGTFSLWKSVICGMTAGSLGQLAASPTDLIKVRMQMEGRRRLEGKPPRVHNVPHAFKTILAEGGVAGLWRGWVPNVQRAALVNMGDLMTYDTVKHQLLTKTSLPDNYIVHSLSSACAGLVASIMCTPADVVKTRVMNQPTENGSNLRQIVLLCRLKRRHTGVIFGIGGHGVRGVPWMAFACSLYKPQNITEHDVYILELRELDVSPDK